MSVSPFTAAHRFHVKSLYKRYLVNALNWSIRRDLWRQEAIQIRIMFDNLRHITNPRLIASALEILENNLAKTAHPDPYIVPSFPGGTKWERNLPPPMGPIFDHVAAERDDKVQKLIAGLKSQGVEDVRAALEAVRSEDGYVDSYLAEHPDLAVEASHQKATVVGLHAET